MSVFAPDLDLDDEDAETVADDEIIVPEHEQEAAHARRGALLTAADEITDERINDLQELDFGPDGLPDPDEAETSFVYRAFPKRHRHAYTEHFFRKVLVCVIKVAQDLCDPHAGPAACTAEEIIRNVIIKHAIALCELAELDPPRTRLSEYHLEDLDFEFLYNPDWDGFENDPALQAGLSMHVPGVQDWFTPFSDDRTVHPYAATEPTTGHQVHDLLARLDEDQSTVLATDIVDAPAPLSGLTPYSDTLSH